MSRCCASPVVVSNEWVDASEPRGLEAEPSCDSKAPQLLCASELELPAFSAKGADAGELGEGTPNTRASDRTSTESVGSASPEGDDEPSAVDVELGRIVGLCRSCRVLDAHAALEALGQRQETGEAARDFRARLALDPTLSRLGDVSGRILRASQLTLEPGMRRDLSWVTIDLQDAKIGPKFSLQIRMRHAQPEERQVGGPMAQLIMVGDVKGLPLTLRQVVALHCEVDLFRKEWVKDCEHLAGRPGIPDKLGSAFLHVQMSPRALPTKLEDVTRRDFALCVEPSPEGNRPGVLVLESDTPEGAAECEGWAVPPIRRGYMRLSGSLKLHRFMPSVHGPEFSDVLSGVRVGLPVPAWAVPLDLVKRFIADIFSTSLRMVKEGPIDHWKELEYDSRIASRSAFYGPIGEIERGCCGPASGELSPTSPAAS